MLDDWKDTGDFRVMYLHWVLRLGEGIIAPDVLDAIGGAWSSSATATTTHSRRTAWTTSGSGPRTTG